LQWIMVGLAGLWMGLLLLPGVVGHQPD
jgi:hypothetical protein